MKETEHMPIQIYPSIRDFCASCLLKKKKHQLLHYAVTGRRITPLFLLLNDTCVMNTVQPGLDPESEHQIGEGRHGVRGKWHTLLSSKYEILIRKPFEPAVNDRCLTSMLFFSHVCTCETALGLQSSLMKWIKRWIEDRD